ncbi:Synaptic vesicular amine transporter [Trichinella nelsoni]|uniref:Synaptic vesicular amine transporter n=1 Tax=Trichinella nelsoni TaxID=6336 RepID=A0A0V0S2T1_9BILA|nr:Synaptic vesicular amine transporter [Trichinella nelsoni]
MLYSCSCLPARFTKIDQLQDLLICAIHFGKLNSFPKNIINETISVLTKGEAEFSDILLLIIEMTTFNSCLQYCRSSRKVLLILVSTALFLDNMLLTTVVPIMPDYLFRIENPNEIPLFANNSAVDNNASDVITEAKEHLLLVEENLKVGLMFGSKAFVQLLTNPCVGVLISKIGYTIPMFIGFIVMFGSTMMFAFGDTYAKLFCARTLQGIGSACTSTAGMGMLAEAYPDDEERGTAMGLALGGLALGVLVGPPFGGVLYSYTGKELPFILLALLALAEGVLQLLVLQPKISTPRYRDSSIKQLVKDPYIVLAAGAITIGNIGIATMEPSLPIWMMDTMKANSATTGAAFLPASISYLIGTNVFGPLAHRIGRWLSAMLGLLTIGGCLIAIPQAKSVYQLIAPNTFMGFAIGMIDASMFPQMGYIVDIRYNGTYGGAYAIADAAFCFAFALGPILSGPLVRNAGFPAVLYIIAVLNFIYAPFLFLLKKIPEPDIIPSENIDLSVNHRKKK